MKVKDLYNVISPFQGLQLFDSKTGDALTSLDYIADSGCEIDSYEDYEIYGIAPKMSSGQKTYLAIMIEMTV